MPKGTVFETVPFLVAYSHRRGIRKNVGLTLPKGYVFILVAPGPVWLTGTPKAPKGPFGLNYS